MKLNGIINGWSAVPDLWRYLLWPPLRVRRESALILDEAGELAIQEAPAVYSVRVVGFVLYLEINRGMRA